MQSKRPFHETFILLMETQEISQREVSRRCGPEWGAPISMSQFARGELLPSMQGMEKLARALQVLPEVFAEYRLGKARAKLDPDQVGLPQALKNLAAIEQAEDSEPEPLSPTEASRLGPDQAAGGGRAASS